MVAELEVVVAVLVENSGLVVVMVAVLVVECELLDVVVVADKSVATVPLGVSPESLVIVVAVAEVILALLLEPVVVVVLQPPPLLVLLLLLVHPYLPLLNAIVQYSRCDSNVLMNACCTGEYGTYVVEIVGGYSGK